MDRLPPLATTRATGPVPDGSRSRDCGPEAPPNEGPRRARVRSIRPSERNASGGFPVVLTADRMLFAGYRTLFEGMVSASQTSRTPSVLMKHLLAPAGRRDGLRARQAPLGLRRVESALARSGWERPDVAVVPPASLGGAIGPETRIIGISSGDPLGLGMNSTTMSGLVGGEIYTSRWFRELTESIRRLRRRAPNARVVMGGAGAWQLAGDPAAQRAMGVDHVIGGYCEGNVAELFDKIAAGESLSATLSGERLAAADLPPVLGPTLMGGVEISRGCGLGCGFCTLAREPMEHLPEDAILADVETNLSGGVADVVLVTEDMFRYGGRGARTQPGALIALLERLRALPRVRLIQADHANIASAAQFGDDELAAVRQAMVGKGRRHDYLWLNLGVETASGGLLAANGGHRKMGAGEPAAWDELCEEQVRRLIRLGFFPLVSLVLGMPGETQADVERTLRWVARLREERLAVFPMFHAPLKTGSGPFGRADMSAAHWRLFRECYRLNFRWVPRLLWDNQSASCAPLWRRTALQSLGLAQTLWWKGLFIWRSGRIRP